MRGAAEAAATTVKGKLTVILCHGDDCIDGKLSCALLLGASKLKGDMLVVCPHSHGQHVWEEVVEAIGEGVHAIDLVCTDMCISPQDVGDLRSKAHLDVTVSQIIDHHRSNAKNIDAIMDMFPHCKVIVDNTVPTTHARVHKVEEKMSAARLVIELTRDTFEWDTPKTFWTELVAHIVSAKDTWSFAPEISVSDYLRVLAGCDGFMAYTLTRVTGNDVSWAVPLELCTARFMDFLGMYIDTIAKMGPKAFTLSYQVFVAAARAAEDEFKTMCGFARTILHRGVPFEMNGTSRTWLVASTSVSECMAAVSVDPTIVDEACGVLAFMWPEADGRLRVALRRNPASRGTPAETNLLELLDALKARFGTIALSGGGHAAACGFVTTHTINEIGTFPGKETV